MQKLVIIAGAPGAVESVMAIQSIRNFESVRVAKFLRIVESFETMRTLRIYQFLVIAFYGSGNLMGGQIPKCNVMCYRMMTDDGLSACVQHIGRHEETICATVAKHYVGYLLGLTTPEELDQACALPVICFGRFYHSVHYKVGSFVHFQGGAGFNSIILEDFWKSPGSLYSAILASGL